jgi:ribosomal protein S27E
MPTVRVQCDSCGEWVAGSVSGDGTVECDCGDVYAVTVTRIRTAEGVAT